MKKTVCWLMSAVMTVLLLPTAFAAESDGLAEAIGIAKAKIAVTEEYSEFESSIYTEENGTVVYSLNWYTEEYGADGKNFFAEVNDKGDVLRYRDRASAPDDSALHFAKFDGEQLRTIAREWLAWVNPSWVDELPEDAAEYPDTVSPYSRTASVIFYRQKDGVNYCGDSVRVTVNAEDGMIVSMYGDWTYADSAYTPDDAMEAEEAWQAYLKESPMELSYRAVGENRAIPVYAPKNSGYCLNGRTGEEFEPFSLYYGDSVGGSGNMKNDAAADTTESASREELSESERKNLAEVEGLLSEQELRSLAEGMAYTGLADAEFYNLSYLGEKDEDETTVYKAELSYRTAGEPPIWHTVRLDAKSGELLAYYGYEESGQDSKPTISADEAKRRTELFLAAYGGAEFDRTIMEEPDSADGIYRYFTYTQTENGIPYQSNRMTVTVDIRSGRICSFYKHWNKAMTFDSADGLISAVDAADALYAATGGLVLSYAKAQDGTSMTPKIDLMYAQNTELPNRIDAKSGVLLGWDSQPYTPSSEAEPMLTDLAGHYAEDAVRTLFATGILTEADAADGFRPDDAITRRELLSFVCGLKNGYRPITEDFAELARRADRSDLRAADPDQTVCREEAAEWMVRALGYQEVAELQGIYQTDFADADAISPERLGYVALAQGLKMVGGDEMHRFCPHDTVSRADAALMMYHYFNR